MEKWALMTRRLPTTLSTTVKVSLSDRPPVTDLSEDIDVSELLKAVFTPLYDTSWLYS